MFRFLNQLRKATRVFNLPRIAELLQKSQLNPTNLTMTTTNHITSTIQQTPPTSQLTDCSTKVISGLWDSPTSPCYTHRSVNNQSHLFVVRQAFDRNVLLPGLRVDNCQIKRAMSVLRKFTPNLLLISSIQSPVESHADQRRLVLFDPDKWNSRETLLTDQDRKIMDQLGLTPALSSELEMCCVVLGYDNLPMDFVFRCLLPEGVIVSGYTLVGHIAHFNLKEDVLPYRYMVGEVVLDKISKVRSVVNKTSSIDNTYRNFQLELIAGEPDYVTTVRENGLVYQLDFSKVYWNSRLSTEHERIVSRLTPSDLVYDIFAGVGPFAIPAGKRGCRVLANDLNPASYDWLKVNIPLNQSKRKGEAGKLNIVPYNMDGRQFIKEVLIPDYLHHVTTNTISNDYKRFIVVMNLPSLATDFLDAFPSSGLTWHCRPLPTTPPLHFHCYLFIRKGEESELDVQTRICDRLGLTEDHPLRSRQPSTTSMPVVGGICSTSAPGDGGFRLRLVRNVAPKKDMYCAEFALTPFSIVCNVSANTSQTTVNTVATPVNSAGLIHTTPTSSSHLQQHLAGCSGVVLTGNQQQPNPLQQFVPSECVYPSSATVTTGNNSNVYTSCDAKKMKFSPHE